MTKQDAEALLVSSIGEGAEFRPQQWEAIDALVNDSQRLLLVQRTGWGKSTVYFIATKFLRDQGAGPTLIISPLLSLMSNQIQDAEAQLGLDAVTINSNNTDAWDAATKAVVEDECDLLLVSPERLANESFREEVLDAMLNEFGMLVVDEAHCISDWGHDFRPDYRRIKRIVDRLPESIPIAATTATANDRVVADIEAQLPGIETMRGKLVRDSLRIQAINLGSRTKRLAWLAKHMPDTPGAGIIYCLTRHDVESVTSWLSQRGYEAAAYHGRIDGDQRRDLEQRLLSNEVDVIVATNALGMGFNKPDLGFVIHFQRPPNLIRYYQEIGRAGRDLDEAYAILLSGPSDDEIAEYFIRNAFPAPDEFETVLSAIAESNEPLYRYEILKRVDVSSASVGTCLDILQLDGAITRVDDGYERTDTEWVYDHDRIERVTEQRWRELERIQEFVETDGCLTRFIDEALDGSLDERCGFCANCAGEFVPSSISDRQLLDAASEHYRQANRRVISPRKRLPERQGTYQQISEAEQLEPGRSLSVLADPGWGKLVREAIDSGSEFNDELVEAAATTISDSWAPDPAPEWVTAVPSSSRPGTVGGFAERLAERLDLPFVDVVEQVSDKEPQAPLENSYQQCWNVRDAFSVTAQVRSGPVLLVDDIVGSRWTVTEVGRQLLTGGSGPVYPFVLADRRGG